MAKDNNKAKNANTPQKPTPPTPPKDKELRRLERERVRAIASHILHHLNK